MDFIIDPPIDVKISKMRERLLWGDPAIVSRGIDQTRFVLNDGKADEPEFSFMVIGDSGSGTHRGYNPQRQIAEQMVKHQGECRFILHTGDVIYLVGSSEYYPENFIEPYQEFLVGGEDYKRIPYDQMIFSLPILPVLGNHDYYDLLPLYGFIAQLVQPLRRLFQSQLDLDVGWHGSYQGMAYARAFLDYLKNYKTPDLLACHLDQHYTALTETGRCLNYQVGKFTRLPNRYYTFRMGGIDFFAIDSNTFNAPLPVSTEGEGKAYRQELQHRLLGVQQEKHQITETFSSLNLPQSPEEEEQINDLRAKLEQLDELEMDIEKQLTSNQPTMVDQEQLDWLENRLVESWHSKAVRGRVLFFHHPPYVTEATKWHQGQTLAVRRRLRQVLDRVAVRLAALPQERPLVDLVLNGHAHCLEYLRTLDTGHADAHLNWIISGGSGYSLRRQRPEGSEVREWLDGGDRPVARSHLYVGRTGQGTHKHRPYSFVRIDVKEGIPPQFVVRPYISTWSHHKWVNSQLEPFVI